ncbi:MAG: helix-turn-helix transcriptional regulator [Cocleimonas sp.]
MKYLQVELGQKIKLLRKENGYSQEAFASLADIDRTYIADIESGKRNVSLEILGKLAVALDLTLSELFQDINGRSSDEC